MAVATLRFGKSLPSPSNAPDEEFEPARPLPPIREDVDPAIPASPGFEDGELGIDGKALTQRMMRLSLAFFASEVIRGDVTSQPNDPDKPDARPGKGQTIIASHQEEWDETVRREKQFCIIAPRDHGKSHIFTIALPIWEAWRRPGCSIVLFSETQPQAEEQLSKLKTEMETNPRLAHLVDPTCWSAKKIRFSNGSIIQCKGFGVKARGMHPHLIICDDVVSEAAMYSALIRDRQLTYFMGAVRNMLVPGGTIAVIGTPQHQDDLYGHLSKNPQWYFKRYAAIDERGNVLFPERYSFARLMTRKTEIGEIRFAREFLGRAVTSGMSLFPDEFVNAPPFLYDQAILGPTMQDGTPAWRWWMKRGITHFYGGVDIATSANVKSDYFVIFVMGLDSFGNRYVVDIFRELGMGYKEQKAKIAEKSRIWHIEMMTIESNGAQEIYGQELIEDTDIPVYKYKTGSEKHSLERGIPSLRMLFENKKYRCPRGNDDSIEATNVWIEEMQSWTFDKEKGVISVAKNDDTAMAQWMCELGIARGESFAFATGEEPTDAKEADALMAEDAALLTQEDDWVMLGLDPKDLDPSIGRRTALDFGEAKPSEKGVGQEARPRHPLGDKVPLATFIFGGTTPRGSN